MSIGKLKGDESSTANLISSVTLNNNSNSTTPADDRCKLKLGTLSPPIIIVGTNKNGLNKHANKSEIIKQKFDKIREFVANKIYASHIIEPFFAIDNQIVNGDNVASKEASSNVANDQTLAGQSDDIELLKRTIQIAALNEPYMGEQQPLKWMKFEHSLEKLKNKGLFYASLSQVKLFLISNSNFFFK